MLITDTPVVCLIDNHTHKETNVSTILNTKNKYEDEVSNEFSSPLGRIWWKIGLKMGYLHTYWNIRLKYFEKLLK